MWFRFLMSQISSGELIGDLNIIIICVIYREYSMSWKRHKLQSYRYTHKTSFGVYNFIAVDVCPNPGPKRPYNFFGVLHLV